MSILTFRAVRKDFGIKEILRDGTFSIESGDKVGLIGTNGSGKSTLLKMLAGLESIDAGQRWLNAGAKVVYLPQQPTVDPDKSVLEQVFADCGDQMQVVRDYEAVSHQLAHATGETQAQLLRQLSRLNEQMEQAGAWEIETQAKIVLSKLGIEDFEVKVGTLSGGYRKRIALAAALLATPDLLLMDEPTNHLDAESVEWLQTYLKGHQGAIILVTHDRYFLDQVTTRILELDRADLYAYDGNYGYYLEKKALAEESELSSQQKHRGVLRRELEWLKRGPKARSTKQKARIQRIEGMQEKEFKEVQGKVEISTPGRRIGKKVIQLNQVSKAYGDRTLIQDFSFEFGPSDRIGIIGGNGAGKTTLMNIITGQIQPDTGSVELGTTIHLGYFDQHSEHLLAAMNQEQRVIDYVKDIGAYVQTADGTQISASQMLERFLFPPNQQYAPINKLSGGEKRRLFLLQVLMAAPNVLILDEPTNDLDVQTLAILEEYLEEFNGCVITVSHDRYFLDRTVETILALEAGGKICKYPGNYSIYLDYKREAEPQSKSTIAEPEVTKPAASVVQPEVLMRSRKLSFKEKRELETLEQRIPELETEKAALEQKLYNNPPSGFTELQAMTERLSQLTDEIDQSTERWLMLSEAIG